MLPTITKAMKRLNTLVSVKNPPIDSTAAAGINP